MVLFKPLFLKCLMNMLFEILLLTIIIERMFILKGCFSNGFVISFLKEIVQAKYLMEFSKERALIIKIS